MFVVLSMVCAMVGGEVLCTDDHAHKAQFATVDECMVAAEANYHSHDYLGNFLVAQNKKDGMVVVVHCGEAI